MDFNSVKVFVKEVIENVQLIDEFEEALLGIVEIQGNSVALYDKLLCIEILMNRDDMSAEDAIDFFEYNYAGAFLGEKTPAFATILKQ